MLVQLFSTFLLPAHFLEPFKTGQVSASELQLFTDQCPGSHATSSVTVISQTQSHLNKVYLYVCLTSTNVETSANAKVLSIKSSVQI